MKDFSWKNSSNQRKLSDTVHPIISQIFRQYYDGILRGIGFYAYFHGRILKYQTNKCFKMKKEIEKRHYSIFGFTEKFEKSKQNENFDLTKNSKTIFYYLLLTLISRKKSSSHTTSIFLYIVSRKKVSFSVSFFRGKSRFHGKS